LQFWDAKIRVSKIAIKHFLNAILHIGYELFTISPHLDDLPVNINAGGLHYALLCLSVTLFLTSNR